ncbi:MAG TPA: DUF1161 domain-containing protein [Burkholderiaceae bacterium]
MKPSSLIFGAMLAGVLPALSHAQSASASASAAAKSEAPAPAAHATCDEMKQRIASQIEGHGVKQYTLEIADAASPGDGKVVAHCGGGKKVLVYNKGGAAKADAKPDAGK